MPDTALTDNVDYFTVAFYDANIRQQVVTTCTSATRPTGVEGRRIYETDTDRELIYDGAAWVVTSSPWTGYTPTITNGVLGNGTLDFRYRYVGWKSVRVRGVWTFGSTSSVSGLIGFSYPDSVTPDTTPRAIGHAWLVDDTSSDFIGSCQSGSSIFVYSPGIVSTSASSPFTWTTGDSVSVDIDFEIA